MVNPPWTFRVFWGIVSPFLDDVTRNKIRVLKKTQDMLDLIPEDQLEEEYGGRNSYKYDYEAYKAMMDKTYPPESEEEASGAKSKKRKNRKKKHKRAAAEAHEVSSEEHAPADAEAEEENKPEPAPEAHQGHKHKKSAKKH